MAVSYIELAKRKFPDNPPYQWHESTDVPFVPLLKSVAQSKVALLSSGGIFHNSQEGFNSVKNDYTYRILDKAVASTDLYIHHDNYNQTNARKDINCVFPYQRFQELENTGVINEFSQRMFTFMGRAFSKTKLIQEMAPAFIKELRSDQVDFALLVPA